MQWLCMPWLGRARKYSMWMSPPFTHGSTRTASTPSAIRRSLLSPLTNPWGRILAWPLSTFFHPLACFTPSCPSVLYLCPGRAGQTHAATHSLMPSLRRRLHATQYLVHLSLCWSKQWKRLTAYSKYMKYGVFLKPNVGQVSLQIMSIPG